MRRRYKYMTIFEYLGITEVEKARATIKTSKKPTERKTKMRTPRAKKQKETVVPMPKGFLIKRVNVTFDGDVTMIGKRFICGDKAEPYGSKSSAETAMKHQMKQDLELCPDCTITYEIVKVGDREIQMIGPEVYKNIEKALA